MQHVEILTNDNHRITVSCSENHTGKYFGYIDGAALFTNLSVAEIKKRIAGWQQIEHLLDFLTKHEHEEY